MNIIKFYLLLSLLLIVPGCRTLNITKEFGAIKTETANRTGHHIPFLRSKQMHPGVAVVPILPERLTRNDAIGIALKNNPQLQALFETLGVAKADLEQSGLYSNPDIRGFFWAPLCKTGMELETSASFKVSDLWQVPLRKEIQKDVLEEVTFTILESILDIMKKVRLAYDETLYAQKRLQILQQVKHYHTDLYNHTCYRQEFGLASDLDIYFAEIAIHTTEIDILKAQNKLSQAHLSLKTLLGISPSPEPLLVLELVENSVAEIMSLVPPLESLQQWALDNRPEILSARVKIKQFEDIIRLEKSRLFDNVHAGISFKKDFDGSRGIGPSFELSAPLFDQNQYHISRFKFLLNQAHKELIHTKLRIQKEVQTHYTDLIHHEKALTVYMNNVLPAYNKAIAHADKFEKVMQVTEITLLQTHIDRAKSQIKATNIEHKQLNAFSHLERAVGKRLDLLSKDSSITAIGIAT